MKKLYTDSALLNILANLRELLPGFLLLYHFFLEEEKKEKATPSCSCAHLIAMLFGDILGLDVSLSKPINLALDQILEEFGFALRLFAEFDDNKMFFSLLRENWKDFTKGKEHLNHDELGLTTEDLLRFRGVLKHITYYNKRYLIPG